MIGDDLRVWFELFDGIVVYRPQTSGGHASDGWINFTDIENRFKVENLSFSGQTYDPSNTTQRNGLLDAIVSFADIFVRVKLLERRRQISPPSLDYRLTPFGRRVGNWGYGATPGFKKRAFFFALAVGLRGYRYRKAISFGAAGWVGLNAVKFYTEALNWVQNVPFGAWSAAIVAAVVGIWLFIKAKIDGNG